MKFRRQIENYVNDYKASLLGASKLLSMAPPKNHVVGDLLIVAKLEFIWFICCILMENS